MTERQKRERFLQRLLYLLNGFKKADLFLIKTRNQEFNPDLLNGWQGHEHLAITYGLHRHINKELD